MAEGLTFSDVVDWLADHSGESVYIEIGTPDPDANSDAIVLATHAELGEVEDAEDTDRQHKAVMVRLPGGDRNRFYLDPQRVTKVQGGPGTGLLKVWIHEAFYIAFSGSR